MSQPKVKITAFEAKTLLWWKARRLKIDMEPPYQRRGRLWSDADKAYLIDSILNGFDVPKLYVADFTFADSALNKKKLPYAIIDGKQRFEAIFDFFDGKIRLNPDFEYRENPALKLGGLGYKDLQTAHPDIAETYDNYNLSVMSVITNSEPLINELFVRLNRSKPLTGAEVRNAMSGPVPAIARQVVGQEFFKTYIAFSVKRAQDLNAATKLLSFEYQGEPQETKKQALDAFTKAAAQNKEKVELAARRVLSTLSDMTNIFLPKDSLLVSAGTLPIYYWFIRGLKSSEYPRVRTFLVNFEELRKENRKAQVAGGKKAIDQRLLTYDQFNRSTNDLQSHVGRVALLQEYFAKPK